MGPYNYNKSLSFGCGNELRYTGFTDYKDVVALYAYIKARQENGESA